MIILLFTFVFRILHGSFQGRLWQICCMWKTVKSNFYLIKNPCAMDQVLNLKEDIFVMLQHNLFKGIYLQYNLHQPVQSNMNLHWYTNYLLALKHHD